MGYRTLSECVRDLESTGQLVRIEQPVDPHLEAAEIQRRVFRAGGPALYFAQVAGCRFPMVSNLFGTMDRVRYLFRDSLEKLKRLRHAARRPGRRAPPAAAVSRRLLVGLVRPAAAGEVGRRDGVRDHVGPVAATEVVARRRRGVHHVAAGVHRRSRRSRLCAVELGDVSRADFRRARLAELRGRDCTTRSIAALRSTMRPPCGAASCCGYTSSWAAPPAMTVAAVMPLPEGMSELAFAGMLGRRRVPMFCRPGKLPVYAAADFCIAGYLDPKRQFPEGPFGDHLGYYSPGHDFPVLRVEHVYHRPDAVWPFTVVGRPPQEDAMFGQLIHELVGPVIPRTIPGVRAVHAVEAAGVHPLLLAIGSERYVPYEPRRRPRELLTLANALLGQGQLSLAKYLWIVAGEDDPGLDVQNVPEFFRHMLERVDWRRDLHFQTCTNIDTLDYSGDGVNEGSKLVIAAAGPPLRTLPVAVDSRIQMPKDSGFEAPRVVLPGILAVEGPPYRAAARSGAGDRAVLCRLPLPRRA